MFGQRMMWAVIGGIFLTWAGGRGDEPPRKPEWPELIRQATNTPWKVTVSVDREDRSYPVGEEVIVKVVSEQPGYLYLFNVDTAGNIHCIFPNQYQQSNQIRAGQEVTVPPSRDQKFRFRTTNPPGVEMIKAVVSKHELKELKLEDLVKAPAKAIPQHTFARAVVEAIGGQPSNVPTPAPTPAAPKPETPKPDKPKPEVPKVEEPKPQPSEVVKSETEKLKQDNPSEFEKRKKDWATGEVEYTVVAPK